MKIIVNADDFGISQSVNDAVVKSFDLGIIDRTSAIANSSAFPEACSQAIKKGFENCVDIHFNITEGESLSPHNNDGFSFFKSDGLFTYRRNSKILLRKHEINAVAIECESQIRRFHEHRLYPNRLNSHEHVHTEWFIFKAIEPVIRKNEIVSVRVSQNVGGFSFVNQIYKKIFNSHLKRKNWISEGLCGDFNAFLELKSFSEMADAAVEIVVHPDYNNRGVLIDASTGEELINPLKQLREKMRSCS